METDVAILPDIMADIPPPPRYFTAQELAHRWRRTIRTIKRLRQLGRLPYVQFGPRDFGYPVEEILRIEQRGEFFQRIDPPAPEPAAKPEPRPRGRPRKNK